MQTHVHTTHAHVGHVLSTLAPQVSTRGAEHTRESKTRQERMGQQRKLGMAKEKHGITKDMHSKAG